MSPSDFCVEPWDSVTQNKECEIVATNIMIILKRTGNKWRKISFEEYREERGKDGNWSYKEPAAFDKVAEYTYTPESAKLFSPDWKAIFLKLTEPAQN